MVVAIGNDHTGYELKLEIIKYLEKNNIEYKDFGCGKTCQVHRRGGRGIGLFWSGPSPAGLHGPSTPPNPQRVSPAADVMKPPLRSSSRGPG